METPQKSILTEGGSDMRYWDNSTNRAIDEAIDAMTTEERELIEAQYNAQIGNVQKLIGAQ